jgi:HEAT repeat protein
MASMQTLDPQLLAYLVLTLYVMSAGLVILSVMRHRSHARRSARLAAAVESLRATAEACFLDGAPLPPLSRLDQEALLELALRYVAFIRGAEADRIVACLEQQGIVDKVVAALSARSEWDRARAAEVLGRLRVAKAVPALIATMDDDSEEVRTVVARSLALIGDVDAVPALARALLDPSRWTLSLVAENLLFMGSKAVPPLLEFVRGGDHNVRVAAVQILGEIRDPSATPLLCEILLEDQNLNLRARAAAALGQLAGPAAVAALLEALNDPRWQVRAQAAKALGAVGDPAAAPALARAIHDREWWVRVNCAEALARLGAPGARELDALQHDGDRYVRDAARAAQELRGLSAGTPELRGLSAGTPPPARIALTSTQPATGS